MNIQRLFESKKVVYSLEVFPPKKTTSIDTIYNTLYGLRGLRPDFISVTYGAGGSEAQKNKTCEIASLIRSEYQIEPVSHLTCVGSTKQDIMEFLDRLKAEGVQNILALRGDITPGNDVIDFEHASDLAAFIKNYDDSFNISGACYPEGHCDSANMDQDIENLKKKVDAGVTHLVSQLFFDNNHFYEFMDKVEKVGIHVPIEAGIMPVINKAQIERTVSMCGASFPVKFSKLLNKYAQDPIALKDAGIAFATEQIIDLINNDVRGIHLYTMNNVETATRITNSISNILASCNRQV
ncbi:methylenetetrahydrofolate reductase [NAD(P)H] [Frisingicoccus caecimuris]|uniref:Methylenetetrahydrofolate reductase n=1 Tax=Frisingicoccus caecimuris TaxID=1796636 RepID=A0A4R2L5Y1_9FIRM|nr:methylenetetrahydrofolate reductase [NAD(P)H] [Frisingicoccus caecimuris]MCR1919930.1 methylenetetrahydrofolate reductase [NAD(P)H] [Frisingicoccus caecimuris]TCO81853.1 5,10-methylenetetrahydrofolate reductase (NAD(P)) [Frisingicoccus caecimuris]